MTHNHFYSQMLLSLGGSCCCGCLFVMCSRFLLSGGVKGMLMDVLVDGKHLNSMSFFFWKLFTGQVLHFWQYLLKVTFFLISSFFIGFLLRCFRFFFMEFVFFV